MAEELPPQSLSVLVTTANDTGYLDRLEMQIAATALSIFNNPGNTPEKREYARKVYFGRKNFAAQWAAAVRVNGANITKATLVDADILSGVETVLNAFYTSEQGA